MTHDSDRLREDLRALLASPAIGLPDYDKDPLIRRRIGRLLVEAATSSHSRAVDGAMAGPEDFYAQR